MNKEEEDYAKKLRPGPFQRWLLTWDVETAILVAGVVIGLCGALLFLAALMPAGVGTIARAHHLLEKQGYKGIQVEAMGLFGCSRDDVNNQSVKFNALSPGGMRAKGYVCCGWLKSCTIRLDQ
jgi:hypothetical protein